MRGVPNNFATGSVESDDKAKQLTDHLIPKTIRLPDSLPEIDVEVVNIGHVTPLTFTGRARPAQPA